MEEHTCDNIDKSNFMHYYLEPVREREANHMYAWKSMNASPTTILLRLGSVQQVGSNLSVAGIVVLAIYWQSLQRLNDVLFLCLDP